MVLQRFVCGVVVVVVVLCVVCGVWCGFVVVVLDRFVKFIGGETKTKTKRGSAITLDLLFQVF